jgi:hypothetical protein
MSRTPDKLFKRIDNTLKEFTSATGSPAPEALSVILMAVSKGNPVTEDMLSSYEDWRESREAAIAEKQREAEEKKKAAQAAKREAKSYI